MLAVGPSNMPKGLSQYAGAWNGMEKDLTDFVKAEFDALLHSLRCVARKEK